MVLAPVRAFRSEDCAARWLARFRAPRNVGMAIANRMAMMSTTTMSSMRVKPSSSRSSRLRMAWSIRLGPFVTAINELRAGYPSPSGSPQSRGDPQAARPAFPCRHGDGPRNFASPPSDGFALAEALLAPEVSPWRTRSFSAASAKSGYWRVIAGCPAAAPGRAEAAGLSRPPRQSRALRTRPVALLGPGVRPAGVVDQRDRAVGP